MRTVILIIRGHNQSQILEDIGVFFHELGHVDHYQNGADYRERKCDMAGGELYAHRYACRRMGEAEDMILDHALHAYLRVIESHVHSKSPDVKKAADEMIGSGEVKKYKELLRGRAVKSG